MFRGMISTTADNTRRLDYTIVVFDEALVIAPARKFERLRFVAAQAGPAGFVFDMVGRVVAKGEEAKLEHDVEELPPDITVEQFVDRFDDAHSVPAADIAALRVTSPWTTRRALLRVDFTTRDVDRWARKRLHREGQLLSDPVHDGNLLTQVFGDKVIDKRREWHREPESPPA